MNKNTKLIFKNIAYLLIIFFLFKFFIFSYFKSIYYTILGLFKKSNSDDSDSNFGNDSDSDTDSDSDSDTDSVSDDKSTYWDMRDVEGFLFFFIFGTLLNLFVALFPLLFSFIIYKKITLLGFFIGFIIQWIFLLNTNPYPLSQNNKLAIMELVPIKYRPEVQFPLNEINRTHFNYPIIIKPTVCSGQGKDVKIVKNKKELQDFFKKTKDTKNYMVQNYLYDYKIELGVLWEKLPWEKEGKIIEISKQPQISERENYKKDKKKFDYKETTDIKSYNYLINDKLNKIFNNISKNIKDFNVGRYDILIKNIEDFKNGNFKILEANGLWRYNQLQFHI